jgi:hypothetical protein
MPHLQNPGPQGRIVRLRSSATSRAGGYLLSKTFVLAACRSNQATPFVGLATCVRISGPNSGCVSPRDRLCSLCQTSVIREGPTFPCLRIRSRRRCANEPPKLQMARPWLYVIRTPDSLGATWMPRSLVLREAQVVIEMWRTHYNTLCPHNSLGYRPQAPLARGAVAA